MKLKPPLLNEEIVEKGNLDRATRKLDSRLLNIQQLIAKATAALVNATDKLHSVTTALADPSARVEQGTCVLWKRPMKRWQPTVMLSLCLAQLSKNCPIAGDTSYNQPCPKTWGPYVAMSISQLLTNFLGMMWKKQSKQQERPTKSRVLTRRAAPPPLQTHRTQQVFFRAGIPAVQSAGKLSRPEGERETLEPERDRKVQGEEPVRKTRIPPAARNQSDKSNEVRTFQDTIPGVKAELRQQSENFKAGQIQFHLPQWQQLTIDRDY